MPKKSNGHHIRSIKERREVLHECQGRTRSHREAPTLPVHLEERGDASGVATPIRYPEHADRGGARSGQGIPAPVEALPRQGRNPGTQPRRDAGTEEGRMTILARRIRRWYERVAARFWGYWQLYMLQRRLRRIIRRHPPRPL